jgi:eukaryotic-like serine/threonine-protein kinase
MTAENWITIKQSLQDVLNLAPLEREEFFRKSGLSDDLKTEIRSLLAIEENAEKFMSVTAGGFTMEFFENETAKHSLVGQTIGIYEITDELGDGGMGAVYLAQRTDGKFEQKVAVKMLKREYNTKQIRRRFELEKEIQAKLHHPNIAALLDSGTTDDGVPYLVMEYIEGVPIDVFCAEKSLDLKARLKLFNKVCEAVGYAHRNLIIHRDLKPSNIIVTEKGDPKLLDFGISKLLDAELSDDTNAVTLLGAMTPEYASPEQIKGEIVTTATDIYSLGVVLYIMLTGTFPYNFENKTNGKILTEITDSEPLKPSAISNFRIQISNSAIQNPKSLKGDVDNIILKSLCKEPERRYKTVEQFSADIWRYIDGIPIMARPATLFYQASKFYQRNKVSVLAGIFVFLALVAGIAAALSQANSAREQANIALEMQRHSELEAEHAKIEEEKAKKITAYMSKVFSYANPQWYAEGAKFKGETKVIEAMDDLGDKIDTDFAGQPDIQAELHHKFADIFGSVSIPKGKSEAEIERSKKYNAKALDHARRALELRRQFYGERHELIAKDMVYLYWRGGVDEKDRAAYLMAAINMMRETNPQNLNLPYMLEDYLNRLMMPEISEKHEQYRNAVLPPTTENKYQIAERYLREMLPVFRLHYKEDNYAIFAAECKLAYTLAMQGKWTDFNEYYSDCKQGEEKLKGGSLAEGMKKNVELVEKVLAENNR